MWPYFINLGVYKRQMKYKAANIEDSAFRIMNCALLPPPCFHLPAILRSYSIILNWARVKKIPY